MVYSVRQEHHIVAFHAFRVKVCNGIIGDFVISLNKSNVTEFQKMNVFLIVAKIKFQQININALYHLLNRS